VNEGKDYITFEDFAKVEMRVGVIVVAEKVENSEKLLKLQVDFGNEGKRQVLSGIAKWYSPEEMIDKRAIFVLNMQPRNIMGMTSEAMIVAAEDKEENAVLLSVPDYLSGGEIIR
jgi:methionine--tRNA ligase beta chain